MIEVWVRGAGMVVTVVALPASHTRGGAGEGRVVVVVRRKGHVGRGYSKGWTCQLRSWRCRGREGGGKGVGNYSGSPSCPLRSWRCRRGGEGVVGSGYQWLW